ncbi:MAG: NAD(P)H-binding protein [Thermoleophilaceae bacterium]|nr:NAD(P)H-binding protein [Thermoleophilaceae bacterium]
MARILIVGCGCRGAALAAQLQQDGHAVRGTTRDPAHKAAIERAGAEAVLADPDRLATLIPRLAGVSAICWLLGSAADAPELHGPRLQTMMARLVETPVRGLVYEAAGSVDRAVLAGGAEIVRAASATWRIPVEVVEEDPAAHRKWLAATTTAVARVLAR